MKKHIKKIIGLFLFAVLILTIPYIFKPYFKQKEWKDVLPKAEYEKLDLSKPIMEQARTIKMAGRTLKIPLIYIDAPLDKGLEQDGLLLVYVLPDFTSRSDFKNKEEYYKAFHEGRFGQMLIEPSDRRPTLETMIENTERTLDKNEFVGIQSGLEKRIWYRLDSQKNLVPQDELYIERDDKNGIRSFIKCHPPKEGTYPQCSHKFRDADVLYKISYNKEKYFPTWREQRKKAIEFFNSFEITPSQGE